MKGFTRLILRCTTAALFSVLCSSVLSISAACALPVDSLVSSQSVSVSESSPLSENQVEAKESLVGNRVIGINLLSGSSAAASVQSYDGLTLTSSKDTKAITTISWSDINKHLEKIYRVSRFNILIQESKYEKSSTPVELGLTFYGKGNNKILFNKTSALTKNYNDEIFSFPLETKDGKPHVDLRKVESIAFRVLTSGHDELRISCVDATLRGNSKCSPKKELFVQELNKRNSFQPKANKNQSYFIVNVKDKKTKENVYLANVKFVTFKKPANRKTDAQGMAYAVFKKNETVALSLVAQGFNPMTTRSFKLKKHKRLNLFMNPNGKPKRTPPPGNNNNPTPPVGNFPTPNYIATALATLTPGVNNPTPPPGSTATFTPRPPTPPPGSTATRTATNTATPSATRTSTPTATNTPPPPPIITGTLQNQTVPVGTMITFNITAIGIGPLNYAWYKNNVLVQNSPNSSYSFTTTISDNLASIKVRVQNAGGYAESNQVNINTGYAPSVQITPSSISTYEDARYIYFSSTASGTGNLSYQWIKNNNEIAGAVSPTLTLTPTLADNNSRYKVRVTNQFGSATSNESILTVRPAPIISYIDIPGNLTVTGDIGSGTLKGFGTLIVNWTYEGTEHTGFKLYTMPDLSGPPSELASFSKDARSGSTTVEVTTDNLTNAYYIAAVNGNTELARSRTYCIMSRANSLVNGSLIDTLVFSCL